MIVSKDKAERECIVRATVIVVEVEHTSICRITIVTATHEPRPIIVNEIGVVKFITLLLFLKLYSIVHYISFKVISKKIIGCSNITYQIILINIYSVLELGYNFYYVYNILSLNKIFYFIT